ncbi:heterokaryon incompatibility protein-domain-containing protein, partial [Podospora fimiseda]
MEPVSDSVYQPLNTEKREIRLLRLHGLRPGDDSVIKCSIQHAVLYVNPPEYSAISYMWGDPGETKTLEISGTEVAIPKNAWEVLEAMCWRQELIWIDSVCINQNHIKERNHQVALMGDIYSSAERVYVWLGRGTERSLQVMDAIRQDGPHRLRTDGIKKLSRLGLIEIYDNAYWNRLWIVQEIVLGK